MSAIHSCPVVSIILECHPNADSLSLVKIDDFVVVANTAAWQGKTKAIYIEPETLVDTTRPEFDFLLNDAKYDENCNKVKGGKYALVRMKKLRSIASWGLLVPVDESAQIGDDYMEKLGCIHYNEPEAVSTGGKHVSGPNVYCPKYDVENVKKYAKYLDQTQDVICTEKVHGSNCRVVFHDGKLYVGSRTNWNERTNNVDPDMVEKNMREHGCDEEKIAQRVAQIKSAPEQVNLYWKCVEAHPDLIQWCKDHPDHIVFGECYGSVQKGFSYGLPAGTVRFGAFDIRFNGNYLEYDDARALAPELPWLPVLYRGPFDKDKIGQIIEQDSVLNKINNGKDGHICEGVVIVNPQTVYAHGIGRVKLKFVSERYSEKKQ